MWRATRALSRLLPQPLRFMIEVISTAALPSSFIRPRRLRPCSASVMSVCMSASFFCTTDSRRAAGRTACDRAHTGGAAETVLGRARRAPGDTVTRTVEAGKRALQTTHLGEGGVFLGTEHCRVRVSMVAPWCLLACRCRTRAKKTILALGGRAVGADGCGHRAGPAVQDARPPSGATCRSLAAGGWSGCGQ